MLPSACNLVTLSYLKHLLKNRLVKKIQPLEDAIACLKVAFNLLGEYPEADTELLRPAQDSPQKAQQLLLGHIAYRA